MILNFLLIFLGLFILIKGADFLVSGSSKIAYRFGLSPLFVGLTIVSFGTSAPELIVSISSALQGNTNLALGNIIGSNIANLLLILGAAAVVYPMKVKGGTIWKELPFSLLFALIIGLFVLSPFLEGNIASLLENLGLINTASTLYTLSFSNGLILILIFIVFLYYSFGVAVEQKDESEDDLDKNQMVDESWIKPAVLVVLGLVGLALGSNITVDNAVGLASALGVGEKLIGLTIIAVGTSLPELISSVTAALKKQSDIAIGNVIGSNIFNIGFILGTTLLVKPVPVSGFGIIDSLFLIFVSGIVFLSFFIFKKHQIGRLEGLIFLFLYLSYTAYLIYRGA